MAVNQNKETMVSSETIALSTTRLGLGVISSICNYVTAQSILPHAGNKGI